MANLVFHNATVLTMEPLRPVAGVVAVQDGRIQAVGDRGDTRLLVRPGARLVDCGGATILPAFHDAHCHVLALASSLLAVDCSPWKVDSIVGIQEAVRGRAADTPPGHWIRARGYHEAALRERRHPTCHDLDVAAPRHPVKLTHQTGHASVLNSLGLAAVGVHRETLDPPEGVIERDPATGEPTGLLLDMEGYLEGRLPPLSHRELEHGLESARGLLLSQGITAVQDASPGNSPERWHLLGELQTQGVFPLRVIVMPGIDHLGAFREEGLDFRGGSEWLRVGHAKIVLTRTTGDLHPPVEALREQVLGAVRAGFPVALHAVEMETVAAAVEVLRDVMASRGASPMRHRIEHASECPLWLAQELGRQGWLVVTQPGFVFYNGDRYLQEVPEERGTWLYPLRWLLEAGVAVAGSSDAPVAPANLWHGICAAVTRRTSGGQRVNGEQGLSLEDALRLYTTGAAYAGHQERLLGSITVGEAADLVMVDQDPRHIAAEELGGIRVVMTVLGGQVVWQQ